MYISERCAECLYSKQEEASKDPSYLKEVRELLDARRETDTAPYMVYLFDRAYQKRFGAPADYSGIKKEFNDLALSMEADAEKRIARHRIRWRKRSCLQGRATILILAPWIT